MSETPVLDAVSAFLTADGWQYLPIEGETMLEFRFAGESTEWGCLAHAREAESQFAFYSILPDLVGPGQGAAIAELTTRINFGLVLGNFEFDMENGDLRYKTSIDVEGAQLLPPLIRQVVYANLLITDRYVPALAVAGTGAITPLEALQLVEQS